MTKREADVIGALNMTDQISNEAYRQIMIAAEDDDGFADFILHWLADMYGSPCEYDYAGINTADYLYEHDNNYCAEGCGTHTDYDCWKKFLELKYQEHKREGD